MQLLNILVLWYLSSYSAYSYSACHEIDIHFLIDTDSILNNGDNVKQFIQSIIWNGSSEYAAFSMLIYGDNIPSDITSNVVINLHETHSIYQRHKEEKQILSKLQSTFNSIQSVGPSPTINISITEAFKHSNDQNKPQRIYKKESILSYRNNEVTNDEYFVFDFYNKLLSQNTDTMNNDDLCALLHDKYNQHNNIHLMMGQQYDRIYVECDKTKYKGNVYEDHMDKGTFFYFDNIMDNYNEMEIIHDITCPANINIDGIGDVSLGNHNQWIDPETIVKCNLITIQNDNIEAPLQLDPKQSHIIVIDYIDDDNSFKMNDYLLGHRDIGDRLQNIGCWSLIYKIIDISVIDSSNSDYNILSLSVQIASSPTEYILSANVDGKQPLLTNKYSKRKLADFTSLGTDGKQLQSLFDSLFDGKWSYSKTNASIPLITIGSSPQFVFTGIGTMNVSLQYDLDIDIDITFKFNWDVLSNDMYLYFTLDVDYSVSMDFNADYIGVIEVAINDILSYSKYMVFSIGIVPVVIKPFIILNAKITTLPLEVNAGIDCKYGESLSVGYEYDKESVFIAEYGVIRSNSKYTLSVTKQWNDILTFDTCLRINYEYGTGAGLVCVWFDYNPSETRCRCYGAGTMVGDISGETGTTAYIMNKECGSIKNKNCDGCYDDIWVKRGSSSGCFPGFYDWQCISCPLFQSNSGYEDTDISEKSIKTRTPHSDNGCTKTLSVSLNDNDITKCPSENKEYFGFDVDIEVEVGCNLYSIITVYGRGILEIPFRINMPEFNNSICTDSSNSCLNTLQSSFSMAMDLAFYLGVKVDFGDLGDIIDKLVDGGTQQIEDNFDALETFIGKYQILPTTNLGCIPLENVLSVLDVYFKNLCCIDDADGDANKSRADTIKCSYLLYAIFVWIGVYAIIT